MILVPLVLLRAHSMKIGIRAPEPCSLCQSLACCVVPGVSSLLLLRSREVESGLWDIWDLKET